MGKDTRPYAVHGKIPYQQWLEKRVMEVKLPFRPLFLDKPKDELEKEISE